MTETNGRARSKVVLGDLAKLIGYIKTKQIYVLNKRLSN
jgi:hypothetical protein